MTRLLCSLCSTLLLAALCVGCSSSPEDFASDDPAPTGSPRGPIGKADAFGSCATSSGTLCGGQGSGACYCDGECATYGDCCSDHDSVCSSLGTQPSEPAKPTSSFFPDDTVNTDLGYEVAANADAAACDVYVDSFGVVSVWQYYHAGYTALLVDLNTASGQNVRNAGMSLVMDDRVTRSSEVLAEEKGREAVFAFGKREGSLFRGLIKLSSDSTDGTEARRTIREFRFFVDVEGANGSTLRLWMRPGASSGFTAADYAKSAYNYSTSQPYSSPEGTASITYLWRDSGSPIFAARQSCLGL